MATTDIAAQKQLPIVKFLCEEVFGEYTDRDHMHAEAGTLQVDRIYEMYEAKMHNTQIDSVPGRDLKDGKECKFRTLSERVNKSNKTEFFFYVSKKELSNKTGDILIGGVNHITNTFDRFRIPKEYFDKGLKSVWINLSRKNKGYGKFNMYLISSVCYE